MVRWNAPIAISFCNYNAYASFHTTTKGCLCNQNKDKGYCQI